MSLDCSRASFNPWHDFLGVLMQQGRVQLDADWNELIAQVIRRVHGGTLDIVDGNVVPRTTPDGFRIGVAGGTFTIGAGRMYVDGLLAQNHGAGPLQWDARLAEPVGGAPVAYDAQPYYPEAPALPAGGPHLVYLDVWQREVTWLQHPDLVEKALGIDTTARLQTVWQVKVLADIGNAQCATPDDAFPAWAALVRPSGARLTTTTGQVDETPNPCAVPPAGGYRGRENQLYRVEIHDGGDAGTATFKWSRDNGSVHTAVRGIDAAGERLVVDSVGRDGLLRFSGGDWVELTDDVLELHGLPGIVRRIRPADGVDDVTRTIVLENALPAGVFPTDAQQATVPGRHTRIRRWDQGGRVLRADGTLYADLGAPGATGLVTVPDAGTELFLEDGILVRFELAGGGQFRTADHWMFAARAADASIELLDRAPPRGIHHHYARLAVATFPDTATDCRLFWPPAQGAGHDCGCDVCVRVEEHESGIATIADAVDRLRATGGVICLEAGIYRLREPVRIEGIRGLRIRGRHRLTAILVEGAATAFQVVDSADIAFEDLLVAGFASPETPGAGVLSTHNTSGLELAGLQVYALSARDTGGVAVELGGYALATAIHGCALLGDVGIADGGARDGYLLTAGLAVSDNLFVCGRSGVRFSRRSLHFGETTVARNLLLGTRNGAIAVRGGAMPGATFRIGENSLQFTGDGIVAGMDGLRIADNVLHGETAAEGRLLGDNGIVLETGLDPSGIAHADVCGNRIAGLAGVAIEIRVPLALGIIRDNTIERAGGGILFTGEGGSAEHVRIEGNELRAIALDGELDRGGTAVAAIQVLSARAADILDNHLRGFGQAMREAAVSAIVVADTDSVRIAGNRLDDVGPVDQSGSAVACCHLPTNVGRGTVADNVFMRSTAAGDRAALEWRAILVGLPREDGFAPLHGAFLAWSERTYLVTGRKVRVPLPRRSESFCIRGNQAHADSIRSPIVQVDGPMDCIFTDNHMSGIPAAGNMPLVQLGSFTTIATSNRLKWERAEFAALDIAARAFTVVGNITYGRITANGAALPAPWNALNVIQN